MNGDFHVKPNATIKTLYFLPNGKGYWIFDKWTKGQILHFKGEVFTYEIVAGKLFLNVVYEQKHETLVFEKQDSKEYTEKEIRISDDVDLPFVLDRKVLGLWNVLEYIVLEEKKNYVPKTSKKKLFLKSATFNPNGEVIFESENGLYKNCWTGGKVLNKNDKTASDYEIKTIAGKSYLFLDWKSGDYLYQGDVRDCYVFEKVEK